MKKKLNTSPFTEQITKKIDVIAEHMEYSPKTKLDLMEGKAGEVLFWAYYSRFTNNYELEEKIVSILSDIFEEVKNGFRFPTYAGGLAGIGWTVEHLAQNNFIKANTNQIIGSLDDYLHYHMLNYIRKGNYDYLHGALGIGLYYLSRKRNTKSYKYLIELVDELERQGIRSNQSITWETQLMSETNLRGFNLSMSHGIASIITFLSRLYEAGICKEKVFQLVLGAISYLQQSKQDLKKYRYQFPAWVCKVQPKLEDSLNGRLAWCYNDLGISIALWQAGEILNNESWKQEAVSILLNTTNIKTLDESKVMDVGLCHGAAGIAHIYKRMYTYSKVNDFRNSALYWFDQSLNMATYKDGLAGYKAYQLPKYGGFHNEYGLLTGISGIGLAMISAISDIEPKWDRLLLLS
jgi:lantibiotic biosynthesis protein